MKKTGKICERNGGNICGHLFVGFFKSGIKRKCLSWRPKNPRKSCTSNMKPLLFIFQSCQPGETQGGVVSPVVRRGGEQSNSRPRPSAMSRPPYRVSRSCEDEADTISVLERLIRTHPVWFLPDITRDEAYDLLQGKEPGVRYFRIYFISKLYFFVREQHD